MENRIYIFNFVNQYYKDLFFLLNFYMKYTSPKSLQNSHKST